jgi:O-antigen/teichoic acid export membrane protein
MRNERVGELVGAQSPAGIPAAGARIDATPTDICDESVDHASQRHAAARNTVAMLVSRLAVAVMGWSGTVLIARLLSPTDWGVYSFVFGLLGMMSIVTDLQVGRVVLGRLLAGDLAETDVVGSSFVYLRAVLGVVGYVIAVGYVVLMGYSTEVVWVTALAGLVVVIATPSHALSVLYQSRLKLVTVATAEACAQLVQLLLTIAVAMTMPLLLIFVLPAIANEIFAGIWKLIGVRRGSIGPRLTRLPQLRLWREMLVEAIPLSVGFGIVTLLSKVDVLMLGELDSFESVGFYTIAYKFADLVAYGVLAVVTPVATLLVAAWPHFRDEFRDRVRTATVAVGLLTTLAVVALWGPAEPVITLLYGERFGEAANATRMLLVGAVFAGLTQVVLVVLVSVGRQRIYPWIALGALAVNLGLNVVLIPHFSYDGSAYATVITEVAMFGAMWMLMARTVPARGLMPVGKMTVTALLAIAICVVEAIVVELTSAPRALVSVGAVAAFIVGAFALRIVNVKMIGSFVPGRRGGS